MYMRCTYHRLPFTFQMAPIITTSAPSFKYISWQAIWIGDPVPRSPFTSSMLAFFYSFTHLHRYLSLSSYFSYIELVTGILHKKPKTYNNSLANFYVIYLMAHHITSHIHIGTGKHTGLLCDSTIVKTQGSFGPKLLMHIVSEIGFY